VLAGAGAVSLLDELDRRKLKFEPPLASKHLHGHRPPDRVAGHQPLDVVDALDLPTTELHDQVLGA
jgi:hypothetical protein